MSWAVGCTGLSVAGWYYSKRAAGQFNRPNLWDYADIIAGVVAATIAAPVYFFASDYPFGIALYRTLVWGYGIATTGWMWGIFIETETDWLPRPDGLAPPPARIRGQQTLEEVSDAHA